jgi:hypothetical protein
METVKRINLFFPFEKFGEGRDLDKRIEEIEARVKAMTRLNSEVTPADGDHIGKGKFLAFSKLEMEKGSPREVPLSEPCINFFRNRRGPIQAFEDTGGEVLFVE